MSETIVTNQLCNACGSEARPHSLFCYNCGGALQFEEQIHDENVSDIWFRSDITEEETEKQPEKQTVFETPEQVEVDLEEQEEIADEEVETAIEKPNEELVSDVVLEQADDIEVEIEPGIEEATKVQVKTKQSKEEVNTNNLSETKLKSASAIRKSRKPSRLKMVEIVWEERENSTNIWFIIFALFLILLVSAMVLLALYLK